MKKIKLLFAFAIVTLTLSQWVLANETVERKGAPRGGHGPVRQTGVPVGHNHIITQPVHEGRGGEVVHPVIGDHRPLASIHHDRNIVRVKVGFFPPGHVANRWDHWHRDWGVFWRFAEWPRINQVTCEAVNTSNNFLYPVTAYRTDYSAGWSNDVGNQLVENALDACYAESEQNGANPDDCVLIDWECRYI